MAKKEKTAFDKLNDKHKLFVMNYVRRMGVGYKAYKDTYPNTKSIDSAMTQASRLLRNVKVKEAVEEKFGSIYKQIETDVEKSKTYKMIHAICDTEISDIIDLEDGTLRVKSLSEIPPEALHAIQSIEMDEKDGEKMQSKNIKVKMVPKSTFVKMRAEIQKLIDPKADNQPIEIIVTKAIRPDKEEE